MLHNNLITNVNNKKYLNRKRATQICSVSLCTPTNALLLSTWGRNRHRCTFPPETHPPSHLIYQPEQRFFEHSKQAVQGLQPDQLLHPLRLLPRFVVSGVWQTAFSCANIYSGISNITLSCFIPFPVSKLLPCRTKQLFMVKCTSAYFIMALHNCFFLLASGGIFAPVLFFPRALFI